MREQHGFKKVSSKHPLVRAVNETLCGDGYHISYNPSVADYGCQTTAIVLSQRVFLVLNGDHRADLARANQEGLMAVVRYFIAHLDAANEMSEHRQAAGVGQSDPFGLQETAKDCLGSALFREYANAVSDLERVSP